MTFSYAVVLNTSKICSSVWRRNQQLKTHSEFIWCCLCRACFENVFKSILFS